MDWPTRRAGAHLRLPFFAHRHRACSAAVGMATKADTSHGYTFSVQPAANRQMPVEVKGKNGTARLQHTQPSFDLVGLPTLPDYRKLPLTVHAVLRRLYQDAAPVWICDLTSHQDLDPNTRDIRCGAYGFKCGKEALFAGVVEIVYLMPCTLFHAELVT